MDELRERAFALNNCMHTNKFIYISRVVYGNGFKSITINHLKIRYKKPFHVEYYRRKRFSLGFLNALFQFFGPHVCNGQKYSYFAFVKFN